MNDIQKALKFYGLKPPIKNKKVIIKKYRKLSMKLHPDGGGNNENFKLLYKYKEILIENFDFINENYKKGINKIDNNINFNRNKLLLTQKFKFRDLLTFSFLKNLIVFLFVKLVYFFVFLLIYFFLFALPLNFGLFENSFVKYNLNTNGFITDGKYVWEFDYKPLKGEWIGKIEKKKYVGEYKNFVKGKKIYTEEEVMDNIKNGIVISLLKGFSLYLLIIILYSIFYFKYKNKLILRIENTFNKNKKIHNFKILSIIKNPKIYYFLGLYFVIFITSIILMIIF